jgi:hypothetical protein
MLFAAIIVAASLFRDAATAAYMGCVTTAPTTLLAMILVDATCCLVSHRESSAPPLARPAHK